MTGYHRSGHGSAGRWLQLFTRRPAARGQKKKRHQQLNRKSLHRELLHRELLHLEPLEQRIVLDSVSWIGGSGNWDAASNWLDSNTNINRVPGSSDDVTISTGSAATITIKSGDGETVHSLTTSSNDTLSFTGGSLTISANSATNSTLSGSVDMTAGSLTVSGTGVTLTVNGSSTVDGGSFYANSGAVLDLPSVTSYTGPATFSPTIQAGDAGSRINLSNLTTLNGSFNNNHVYVHAYGGGQIDMHQLSQITSGAVDFQAQNSGTTIDLSALAAFNATSSNADLESDSGATLDIGSLTTLDKVALTIGGPASVSQITTVTNGSVGARDGATPTFTGLTNFTNDNFYAHTAGVLNLPAVSSYTGPNTFNPYIEAGDAGSEINLSNLRRSTAPPTATMSTSTPTAGH